MNDVASLIDLRATTPAGRDGLLDAGDEMAVCLGRFLTASVDERTMRRAREALIAWSRLAEIPKSCA